MRWSLRSLLLPLIASVMLSGTAQACINDREVGNAEREFKSNYNYKPGPSSSPSPDASEPAATGRLMVYGGVSMGTLLLIGASVLCLMKPRRS